MDPNGKSGIVTIDNKTNTVTATSHYLFYGSGASAAQAQRTATSIQNKWNAANGTTVINGQKYNVKFVVTGDYVKDVNAGSKDNPVKSAITNNKDISQNFVKISDNAGGDNLGTHTDASGGNTGQWKTSDVAGNGNGAASHEFGVGLGAPESPGNMIGKGQPGIMTRRGSGVDAQFTQDPSKGGSKDNGDGSFSNPVDATKREVTQDNINALGLDKLNYDKNGQASLGSLSNQYHQ